MISPRINCRILSMYMKICCTESCDVGRILHVLNAGVISEVLVHCSFVFI